MILMMSTTIAVVIAVVCAVVFAVIGFVLGSVFRQKANEKEIGSATQEATKIINDALQEAETTKKTSLIEAKDEIHKLRSDADKEIRERRSEVQKLENRLNQREEYLDKRADSIEAKNESLSAKLKEADDKLIEIDSIKKSQFDMLEKISGLSQEEAKKHLLASPPVSIYNDIGRQVLAMSRGGYIFIFNFSPVNSYTDYGVECEAGSYSIVLDTDWKEFDGFERNDRKMVHRTLEATGGKGLLKLYLPQRSAFVLKKS